MNTVHEPLSYPTSRNGVDIRARRASRDSRTPPRVVRSPPRDCVPGHRFRHRLPGDVAADHGQPWRHPRRLDAADGGRGRRADRLGPRRTPRPAARRPVGHLGHRRRRRRPLPGPQDAAVADRGAVVGHGPGRAARVDPDVRAAARGHLHPRRDRALRGRPAGRAAGQPPLDQHVGGDRLGRRRADPTRAQPRPGQGSPADRRAVRPLPHATALHRRLLDRVSRRRPGHPAHRLRDRPAHDRGVPPRDRRKHPRRRGAAHPLQPQQQRRGHGCGARRGRRPQARRPDLHPGPDRRGRDRRATPQEPGQAAHLQRGTLEPTHLPVTSTTRTRHEHQLQHRPPPSGCRVEPRPGPPDHGSRRCRRQDPRDVGRHRQPGPVAVRRRSRLRGPGRVVGPRPSTTSTRGSP